MTYFQAFWIAILEGLTEFLPVSSTGHMIVLESLMGLHEGPGGEFVKLFTVAIQLGAILSVVAMYWRRFLQSIEFYITLIIATVPILGLGFLLKDYIDQLLESPLVVGVMLLLGGIVFLFVDRLTRPVEGTSPAVSQAAIPRAANGVQKLSHTQAAIIGGFQCLGLVPGVSRSASTIVGGLFLGLTRKNAAEFSFFLAVPTMSAATLYKLYSARETLTADSLPLLLFGNAIAFVVAAFAIRFFVAYVSKHGFKAFGWYRIAAGLAVIAYFTLVR